MPKILNLFFMHCLLSMGLTHLTSCAQSAKEEPTLSWQTMNGRDGGSAAERFPLYRAKVPSTWIRCDPSPLESLADTKKAICEFHIQEGEETLRLTVHTFPVSSSQPRIPPLAQITRWKNQFDVLDPLATHVTAQSHGGFIGLLLEAQGIYQSKEMKMLAWSMQLAPEYDRLLSLNNRPLDEQQRADYTIKIVASPSSLDRHRKDFMHFANSFELIEELPFPL